jgi:benzylsuccinate CoA-transferase BbsF subunit
LEGLDLPLAGVRVLEFGYGVAAPVCCRNLAQYGADVIRVESVRRPDSLRLVGAGWVPPEVRWDVTRDTGQALNFTCPGKRSVGLEVDTGEGRAIFLRLVAASDVLVMNMSIEAVAGLGLGYREIRDVRQDIIWMNMPSFGAAGGPYQGYRTWGRNIAAMAGIARLVSWPDRDPVGMSVNYPDYVSALWGTIAVVCAVLQRDLTGEGCEIDVSQYQVAVSCIGPTVMEAVLGGTGLGSLGNRYPGMAPHGVYPARGRDRWVALSVHDEEMWRGMCGVAGLESLADDPRFSTLEDRITNQEALDELVSGWTGGLTPWEAATELQSAGVAAYPVHDNASLLADPQLEARDFFRVLPHPRFGTDMSYGQAIRLCGTPGRFERAAPGFGEHTREILSELAWLGDDEIDAAIRSGVAHEMVDTELRLQRPYFHWIHNLVRGEWPKVDLDPAAIIYQRMATDPELVASSVEPEPAAESEPAQSGEVER